MHEMGNSIDQEDGCKDRNDVNPPRHHAPCPLLVRLLGSRPATLHEAVGIVGGLAQARSSASVASRWRFHIWA